jgi:hypothetical protein
MAFRIPTTIAALALAASVSGGAQAAVISFNTLPIGATYMGEPAQGSGSGGAYGVELRGGRSGLAGDWEIGAGRGTSRSGNFTQGQFDWASLPGAYDFTLTWTTDSLSITVGATTVTYLNPQLDSSTGAPLVGNTLRVTAGREAVVTFTSVDGLSNPAGIDGNGPQPNEVYFVTDDNWGGNGLTVTGTVDILGGGGSANTVFFRVGETTLPVPVPEPATLALLGMGLAGLSFAARRRRNAA